MVESAAIRRFFFFYSALPQIPCRFLIFGMGLGLGLGLGVGGGWRVGGEGGQETNDEEGKVRK